MIYAIKNFLYLSANLLNMNRIKIVLEEKGIKQTWLAEKLGKSYNMINSYVQNRRQPSLLDLNKIAEILDIDVRELIQSNKKN
jgi:putative transcriptional regulator